MSDSINEESYQNLKHSKSPSLFNSLKMKPKRGNFILRQDLDSYTPECNPKNGILLNLLLLSIFLGAGIPLTYFSNQVIEIKIPYTDCSIKTSNNKNSQCLINLEINSTIFAPVYFYYEFDNFHLNHRNLVKSKIWSQLRGVSHIDSTNNSKCDGAIYMNEMFDNDTSKYKTFTGKALKANDFANPCGLVAKSFFNGKRNILFRYL